MSVEQDREVFNSLGNHKLDLDLSRFKVEGNIRANRIEIGKNVVISPDTEIIADKLVIGDGTVLTGRTIISCMDLDIGPDCYLNGVWIEGSPNAGETRTTIGNECLILQGTRLNCNAGLSIGEDVNIGQNVAVWTHASSMNVLDGYPFTLKPITIGSHVWITDGTRVLPGVNIGDHVVVGNLSVVNKDLPSGCFAAGIPAKIIKENIYPKVLTLKEKEEILTNYLIAYKDLLKLKPEWFQSAVEKIESLGGLKVKMEVTGERVTIFDCQSRLMIGSANICAEDFRDFLRSRGMKIPTGWPYQSVPLKWYLEVLGKN